ncbi:MAG: hypothetical protein QM763_19280 [Agriterribacter sp.]
MEQRAQRKIIVAAGVLLISVARGDKTGVRGEDATHSMQRHPQHASGVAHLNICSTANNVGASRSAALY